MSESKKCPFCGGEIKAGALKCRYCREWLDDAYKETASEPAALPTVTPAAVSEVKTPLRQLEQFAQKSPAPPAPKKKNKFIKSLLPWFWGLAWIAGLIWCCHSCLAEKESDFDPVALAEKTYKRRAEGGSVPDQIALGMYYFVCGQKEKAVIWLRKAAAGDDTAKLYLANMLTYKGATAAEKFEGFYLFKELADKGNNAAMVKLGILYLSKNDIVNFDAAKGFAYLSKVYKRDISAFAELVSGKVTSFNGFSPPPFRPMDSVTPPTGENDEERRIIKDIEKKIKFFKEYCYVGKADCYLYLGVCYRDGIGTAGDHARGSRLISEAVKIYEEEIKKNNSPVTLYKLGFYYCHGIGVVQNREKALELLQKSADGGCAMAKSMLEKIKK
ncbi:MAG: sel1 repeat family protein [Lentisphaeria bacterium]|nr:sel1 repeat family protein [Lentisphaeria bacterium]